MHLLTQSAVLRSLGWSLFNSFWQMALLWLLYSFFIHLFKKVSAHARHRLALLMLGTGAAWSAISFADALFFPGHADPATWLSDLLVAAGYPGTGFLSGASRLLVEVLPYGSFIYLLVLFCLFIRYSGQYLYSRRLKGTGLSRVQPECRLFVEETRQLMGIRKKVQVWLSSLVEGPVTLGYFKPVILIPIATASNLSLQQVEAILLHELAHIKRNDYLLNLGVSILEVLFFFNPFARLLIRDIKREREHRCDDLVMQFRYDPHAYVSALLSLASGGQGNPQLALAATGGNDQLLLQRVRRILKIPGTNNRPGVRSLLFLFFTLSITCLTGLGLAPRSIVNREATLSSTTAVVEVPSDGRKLNAISVAVATESAGTRIISVAVMVKDRDQLPAARKPEVLHRQACKKALRADDDPDDEDAGYVQVSEKDDDGTKDAGEYASLVHQEKRDYSISTLVVTPAPTASAAKKGSQNLAPFVPGSSFSYKYVQDSTRPDQQFVYLQKLACKGAEEAVRRMQKELQLQLHILQLAHSTEQQQALRVKRQILEEQLKLQEQYLQKQRELQSRFERAATSGKKQRKIVII